MNTYFRVVSWEGKLIRSVLSPCSEFSPRTEEGRRRLHGPVLHVRSKRGGRFLLQFLRRSHHIHRATSTREEFIVYFRVGLRYLGETLRAWNFILTAAEL